MSIKSHKNPPRKSNKMSAIPLSIVKYIRSLWMSEMILTYFHIDQEGLLVRWGGHPRHYGLSYLNTQQPANEQIAFLEGLLPVTHTQILEFVGIGRGKVAHVHLIPFQEGTWVLMFDATVEHERQQQMQQRANELSLLTYRQARLLEELEQTRAALFAEKQRLEEITQQKSQLIASLSHELRSPLTSLIGYTELLTQVKNADQEEQHYLTGVRGNINHLLNLVDNVLNQATLENNKLQLNPINSDIKSFIGELSKLFLPMVKQKNLTLSVHLDEKMPARLWIDELRLRQIFINLLSNALKFTEQGRIELSLMWQNDQLHFAVIDSGAGVKTEAREKIFQAFHRESENTQTTGTGLGLAITRQLIELMQGHIAVTDSPYGTGAKFYGYVEAKTAHIQAAMPSQEKSRFKILIAEDCAMIHTLLELYLTEAGYFVLSANDGEEALALAALQPDLILIDMHMPKYDGDVVVRNLREKKFNKPIIAISASDFETDRLYALRCGCDAYLTKPVESSLLLETVARYLSASPAHVSL
ncbi:hybrid sensor histidine kinase/response regulator [Thioflexithrix psekupsensis]|uniref:histidine kinase n=1 Tax=Thioflexithrix psekupsensis TaxID=1570016 RepID=A0A251X471_9GAMM|nr:ATP-binding protein [Thioflexithrix psekupsensis]OUD12186.1 hypothetical protein TPSD3_13765 [Thioflexithrix psekupsensis]